VSEGKGRPTPTRKEQEAARKQHLIPADRKAAAKASRVKEREQRQVSYEGMQRGEEKYLQSRDRGDQRRFIREYVDARWNLGEFFLPVSFLGIILNFLLMQVNPQFAFLSLAVLYLFIFACIIDAVIMWLNLKRRLRDKFGEPEKGTAIYAAMRAMQIRRSRIPKPLHAKHGNWPV
jgi:hypothetical protein